jgi:hypothetical protein
LRAAINSRRGPPSPGRRETIEDVERDVLSAKALLWIAWDQKAARLLAAVATSVVTTPRHKVLLIRACGGRELHRWKGFIADLEAYGVAEGCVKLRVSGRPGWKMVLPDDYRVPFVTLEKDLTRHAGR